MKTLSDKSIQFRTFPIYPRKRVKFDADTPVEFTEFGSSNIIFKALGGYFSHNSYRLLDFFTSYWFEVVQRNWLQEYGSQYPAYLNYGAIKALKAFSPLLNIKQGEKIPLMEDRVDLYRSFNDFTVIDSISDQEMRRHPSLQGITSSALFEIITKTAGAKFKTTCPIRMPAYRNKKVVMGWGSWTNLKDSAPWSKLFDYRLLEERTGADGRIIERIYKFGFHTPLAIAMIHNTVCGGTWAMNPKVYEVSSDAQLLYRYLVITGSRRKNNTVEYLGHRIGWREKQKKRLVTRLEAFFEELKSKGLIKDFEVTGNQGNGYSFSFEIFRKNRTKKQEKAR